MNGFFKDENEEYKNGEAIVHWHTSENMYEIENNSAKLCIGASVYLGKGIDWVKYEKLYDTVYNKECWRVIKEEGYLVIIQTDAYIKGKVLPRNTYLPTMLLARGWVLIDVKVWKRRAADFFQPPFSQVFVFTKSEVGITRRKLNKNNKYFQGIWEYKQTAGGVLNSYPEGLCRMLIETFTEEGDIIVDPFAGTAVLLGIASRLGRVGIGYEINEELKQTVASNIRQ